MLKKSLIAAIAVSLIAVVTLVPRLGRPRAGTVMGDVMPELMRPRCEREQRVGTPDQLLQILRSEFVGCVVVTKDGLLDMTGQVEIPIGSGVTLMGERGELGSRPIIWTDAKCRDPSLQPGGAERCDPYSLFAITGNDVSVTGLHLRGPAKGSRACCAQPYVHAIKITADPNKKLGRGIQVAENEFDEWPGSGVEVVSTNSARTPAQYDSMWTTALTRDDAGRILVERNFFHHNARDGGGYGVTVSSGAFATVMGNVFDFNRHAVASDGFAHTGYIARFNYVLQGGFMQDQFYNQHFDVHGTNDENGDNVSRGYGGSAGEYYEIAYNTIRGDEPYYCFLVPYVLVPITICPKTRAALWLRGKPTIGLRFDANVLVHDDLDAAVALKMETSDKGWGEDHQEFNFDAAGNQFDTDRSGDLATGDFDGDGRTDVFVATGTAWFFSRGGQGAWEFLHASNKLTSELGFADIDNDGMTDVLYRDGTGKLGFLKSGRVPLRALTTTPEPMANLRFGDFDGDGLADIFYTRDHQWRVWYGRLKEWRPTQTSSVDVADLLVGEFDTLKGTDVAAVTDDKWQISSGSTGSWTVLNSLWRSSFRGAVVADFDGDGRSDIAFDDGDQRWSFSPRGSRTLRSLRDGSAQVTWYPELSRLLVGRFDGDVRAEVVGYYVQPGPSVPVFPDHFVIWRGRSLDPFETLSWHAMR